MNIAVLVGRLGPGTGTGGVAHRLVRWLRDRGHRIEVWCTFCDSSLQGVAIRPMGSRWTAAARVSPGFVRLALDRTPGCEVVRASGGVHRAWLAARGGIIGPRDWLEDRLDRATARTASRVICNSLQVAGEIVAWHGVASDRIRVVRTSVDADAWLLDPARRAEVRAAWGVPAGGRTALFVGHGFRRKGLDTAVEAFALASGPDDRLVVAGTDSRAARRIGRARERLGARLVSTGALVPMASWLGAADVMILPSRYDAAANATLEALAAGVPPVVSARDGASELVPDRRLVVADPTDANGFAASLRYAWQTPGLGRLCAAVGRRWPEARMAEAVEHILGEIANG